MIGTPCCQRSGLVDMGSLVCVWVCRTDNPWVWHLDIVFGDVHRKCRGSCMSPGFSNLGEDLERGLHRSLSPLRISQMACPWGNLWGCTNVVATHNRRTLPHLKGPGQTLPLHGCCGTMALSRQNREIVE